MNILISADWHFSDNPRDAYRFDTITQTVPKLLKKHKVDLLLYLGDICESKDEHKAELVNKTVGIFHRLSQDCPVVVLQGNHDWLSSPNNPFFGFLGLLEGVQWISRPTPLQELFPSLDVPRAILLPHSADYRRDWSALPLQEYDWAFCHQAFSGAKTESGFTLPGGVPLDFFPENLRLVSGDIHRPQQVESLTYVGSPYPIDFGDDFEPRMLLLKGGQLKSLPCEGAAKVLVDVQSLEDLKKVELLDGDVVKVRFTLSSKDMAQWPETLAKVRAWGDKAGLASLLVQPVVVGGRGSMATLGSSRVTQADDELLKAYAAAREVGADVLKVGLKYI